MPVFANEIRSIDMPSVEILPSTFSHYAWLINDYRGTNRYAWTYLNNYNFYPFDCYIMSVPYKGVSSGLGTVGVGTSACFDPSRGTAGYIWNLVCDGSATVRFEMYDCGAGSWTGKSIALQQGGNIPNIGTASALTHTCSSYNAAGNDDFIYLIGNNATMFYRYSISNNVWYNSGSTPAITACLSASAAGCGLMWMPGWNTDRIVRIRGGATATIDYYSILNNNWTGITYTPATETFTTGTWSTPRGLSDKILISYNGTGRVYELNLTTSKLYPMFSYLWPLAVMGSASSGNTLIYLVDDSGVEYALLTNNSGTGYLIRATLR